MTRVFVGLGSNLGDRRAHLDAAVAALRPVRVSRYLETAALLPAEDATPQPAYLNAVVELHTERSAQQLLSWLREIEAARGRPAQRARWQPRPLDLDILLFGEAVIREAGLEIPHPGMHQRPFVLEPFNELAPEVVHPTLGLTVHQLWQRLPR